MERKETSHTATQKEKRQTKKAKVTSFADLSLTIPDASSTTTRTSVPNTFTAPRELSRQLTKPVPQQGNIFDLLNPKAAKHALLLEADGNLFSTITDGIDCSPLVSKVIIALSQFQYEQSIYTGNRKLLTGLSDEKKKSIEEQLNHALPSPVDFGERDKSNNPIKTPFAYIVIDRTEFAKRVNGGSITGGKDIEGIMDILSELERKEVFIDLKNGHYRSTKLLTILGRDMDTKTGKELLLIQLSPLFARAISHDYVTHRKDILLMMKGKQLVITMKLYHILIETHSYRGENSNQKNDLIFKIDKATLFSRIATIKKYKDHPKKRAEDFTIAVQRMKDWLLITDYREELKESGVICIFTLNPNWKTAPTPNKYLSK